MIPLIVLLSVSAPFPSPHGSLHDSSLVRRSGSAPFVNLRPYVNKRGIFHGECQMLQLLVHPFQLGAYGEYNLHALLLRHFRVVHTHLPDVVHDFHASQYQVTVNLVPPGCQCHGKSPFSVLPKLLRQVSSCFVKPPMLSIKRSISW